jgi:acyl carrier protein
MTNIFDVDQNDITDESTMENMEKWDSLAHLILLTAIEKEFRVEIDTIDKIELTSFTKIKLYLKNKI